MKTYMTPEIELTVLPAMHTVELTTSWPWDGMDEDETEIIG